MQDSNACPPAQGRNLLVPSEKQGRGYRSDVTEYSYLPQLPHPDLPAALMRVPQAMRDMPHWVLWRIEPDQHGKSTKVPYQAVAGKLRKASSTDPKTWRAFDEAVGVLSSVHGSNFSGIGFCFEGSGIAGADFDNVVTEGGVIVPWAGELVAELKTYSEISPNGTGIHSYPFGEFAGGGKKKKFSDGSGFEFYCRGRFFTVTGNQLAGAPSSFNRYDCQALADRYDRGEIGPTVDCVLKQIANRKSVFTPPASDKIFDLAAFLARNSVEVLAGPARKDGTTLYEITCPWADGNHKNARDGRAFVGQRANGALIAGCLHESCSFTNASGNRWDDLRHRYEPPPTADVTSLAHSRQATTPQTSLPTAADCSRPKAEGTPDLLFGYASGDIGNGERFLAVHGDEVLFDGDSDPGQWYLWDGIRWRATNEHEIRELAHEVAIAAMNQALRYEGKYSEEIKKRAFEFTKTRTLSNALREAKPKVLVRSAEFDTNHFLLNFTNGTLDLETNKLREAHRKDRITKVLSFAYDLEAKCPRFDEFTLELMGGLGKKLDNGECEAVSVEQRAKVDGAVEYLDRTFGYSLTGDTSEKAVFVFHGPTNTGKSTLLQTVREILGDYATVISIDALTTRERNSMIEEQLYSLRGVRFAITSESGKGVKLSEARLKQITQGQNAGIVVTPKFKPAIIFKETHKLFLDCNDLPVIRGDGDDIWERLRVLPFRRRFASEEQDKHLRDTLLAEAPGIVARLVRGYQSYRGKGLPELKEMLGHWQKWRDESNPLKRFLADSCDLEATWRPIEPGDPPPTFTAPRKAIWDAYVEWRTDMNEPGVRKSEFYDSIEKLPGVRVGQPIINGKQERRGYFGITLKEKGLFQNEGKLA
jgi:putative DNA primase/helicase